MKNEFSNFAKDGHLRASRMLAYALTLIDAVTWSQTAAIFALRLTKLELVSVAFAALSALDPSDRQAVFEDALWEVL